MIYNAPEVKVLAALANVAATSAGDEEDDPFGGQTFIGDCL